jgi:hypothetical protein
MLRAGDVTHSSKRDKTSAIDTVATLLDICSHSSQHAAKLVQQRTGLFVGPGLSCECRVVVEE